MDRNELTAWALANGWQMLAGCPSLTKPQFRAEVSDVLRKAQLKKIQIAEEKGDFKEAADSYIEYTKAFGNQDEALFEKALSGMG